MSKKFDEFLKAFPIEKELLYPVDAAYLTSAVSEQFRVNVPHDLAEFWTEIGCGYLGEREIYFFGDGLKILPRDSLIEWNKKDFWIEIFPPPERAGPLFFAETCFGDQLGFRWEGKSHRIILFDVNSFESFVIADDFAQFFTQVLTDRYALYSTDEIQSVKKRLGTLPVGMHYTPFVSPLIGGSHAPENFFIASPNVHFKTAIAEHKALKGH